MPTFRNDGERPVIYNDPNGTEIIIFDPGKNVQLIRWVPYKRLGLTLVSESYPAVPDTVLISGEFKFTRGMKRRFDIEPCNKYAITIYPISGSVMLHFGASTHGLLINRLTDAEGLYKEYEWKYAPYIMVACCGEEATANIQATLKE